MFTNCLSVLWYACQRAGYICVKIKRCPCYIIQCKMQITQDSMCDITHLCKTVCVFVCICVHLGIHMSSRKTHPLWLVEFVSGKELEGILFSLGSHNKILMGWY